MRFDEERLGNDSVGEQTWHCRVWQDVENPVWFGYQPAAAVCRKYLKFQLQPILVDISIAGREGNCVEPDLCRAYSYFGPVCGKKRISHAR